MILLVLLVAMITNIAWLQVFVTVIERTQLVCEGMGSGLERVISSVQCTFMRQANLVNSYLEK